MDRRQLPFFPRMIIGLMVGCLLASGVMGEAVVAQTPPPDTSGTPAPGASPTPDPIFTFQECEEVDEVLAAG